MKTPYAELFPLHDLAASDPAIYQSILDETERQFAHVELIASENYVSRAVLQAQGSVLTNKYAEGYPGKRYYGGCKFVDVAEELAIARLQQLFGADYANVQPHSGSSANAAVYLALMEPGDTLLGMRLNEGGHLTHGTAVNFSGTVFKAVQYGLDPATHLIDYDQVRDLARLHQPKVIVAGFSAYSRELRWDIFREIADEVGAYLVADMAHVSGLVATHLYPSPMDAAHVVTSTTHKTLRGPRGGIILSKNQPDLYKKLNSRIFPGTQGGPLMHVIAAKAVAFGEALRPEFTAYQRQVVQNAQVMSRVLQERGYDIVSGGTDNHLCLVSLIRQGLTGKAAEAALEEAHITTNKNTVPQDPLSPFVTSGIRIGTPAITTRGFQEAECAQVAAWIADIFDALPDADKLADTVVRTRMAVAELTARFPVYT